MGGALVLLGGLMVGRALPGGLGARQSDAAAEVQDLVNRLGALSGAAGVYLVPRLPVPAPMGSGSSSALPGGLAMAARGGPAARCHSLVRGWAPSVGLRPRVFGGCGLVAEGFVGLWWCTVLWVAPWGWVSVGPFGWRWSWSGCCEGLGSGLFCGVRWVVWFAEWVGSVLGCLGFRV